MAIIPLHHDLLAAAQLAGDEVRWPTAFINRCYARHRPYFDGLEATYGPEAFGLGGALGAAGRLGLTAARQINQLCRTTDIVGWVSELLAATQEHLPIPVGHCYLSTLLYMAPGATLSVNSQPTIAIGLERFSADPADRTPPRWLYQPDELAEIIPHEACHAIRMAGLGLPPSPRHLTLLDMVMLEGTALCFTDALVGRQTLRTFMPAADYVRHEASLRDYLVRITPDLGRRGLPVFERHFRLNSPISGYYMGYRLCREYLFRTGCGVSQLALTPSATIWAEVIRKARPGTAG